MKGRVLFALSLLCACNGAFGLDEGVLGGDWSDGGNGVGGNSTSSPSGATGGMEAVGAGNCVDPGLSNGEFIYWNDPYVPDDWQTFQQGTTLELGIPSGYYDGVGMNLNYEGGSPYGGLHQNVAFIEWDQCVEIGGTAFEYTGTDARLRLAAVFNDESLTVEIPLGDDFATANRRCRPSQVISELLFEAQVDQFTSDASLYIDEVHFNHVCCEGNEGPCDPG
jgi:hypothetical protein